MATEVGSAYLTILPSAKGFGKKLSGGIDPEMGTAGRSAGSKFGSGMASSAKGHGAAVGKVLGAGILGALGVALVGVGAVLKTGFGEAMDASAGTAQLAAGIKSTGNAAQVSVKGLNALASSIQGYSGQTDDSIVKSEQLLLTFTKIKNTKTDKIFDRATVATANMAAKMGGDASGAAIQLGKALNDPVKGISALSRVGVSFTAAQKESIKAMVKHGDVAGAQKIILKELETEFGGAAKAAGKSLPGQLEIAKRSFEDVSQAVMEGVLPVLVPMLTGVAGFVTGTLVPGIQALVSAFQAGGSDVTSSGFAGVMERVGLTARRVWDVISGVISAFKSGGLGAAFASAGTSISAAWPGIQAQLGKWGVALWAWIQDAAPPMLVKLGELWVKLETWIWGTALPAIVAKLVAWGKAFVAWIAPMIPPALVALGGLLTSLGNWIWFVGFPMLQGKLAQWGRAFWAWVVPAIGPLLVTLGGMLGRLGVWIGTVALPAILVQLGKWAWAFIKWVGPMIPPMLLELGKLIQKLGWWLQSVALPAIVGKLVEWNRAFWSWVPGAALRLIVELGKLQVKLGAWFLTKAIPAIVGYFAGLPAKISSAVSGMWDGLKDSFRSAINWIISHWNSLSLKIPAIDTHVPGIGKVGGFSLDTPNIPLLAAGGIVPATPGGRLVRVAEGGQDEAIVPLGRNGGFSFDYDRLAAAMSRVRLDLDGRNVAASVDQRLAPR